MPKSQVVLSLLVVAALPCWSQHEHSTITSGTQTQLPGSVNGAITPELIPDVVAYRLFLKALAGDDADQEQEERRRSLIRKANLTEDEYYQLTLVLKVFKSEILALNKSVKSHLAANPSMDDVTADSFERQRDQIATDARTKLEHQLSVDGMRELHALIMSEKKNMTAVVAPTMAGATTK